MIETIVRRTMTTSRIFLPLMALGLLASPGHGQTVAGKWIASWRVLDNGESDRMFLDLYQTDTHLTGTVTTLGHLYHVEGTLKSHHFELFTSASDTKPRWVGDVEGNELHLTRDSDHMTAVPAQPGDEYPVFEHIQPPALHVVPDNGLAKTPPMGWSKYPSAEPGALFREPLGAAEGALTRPPLGRAT
jgi:alpha-galactosidase